MDALVALKAFNSLVQTIGTIRTIRNLVRSEVADLLDQLGDVHANAARRVLMNDVSMSSQPEHQLREIITHLNAAFEHYVTAAQNVPSLLILFVGYGRIQDMQRRACFSAALVACCYHLLGEHDLKRRYFIDAQSLFYAYAEPIALEGNGEVLDRRKYHLTVLETDLLRLAEYLDLETWRATCLFEEVPKELSTILPDGHEISEILPVTQLIGEWTPPPPRPGILQAFIKDNKTSSWS